MPEVSTSPLSEIIPDATVWTLLDERLPTKRPKKAQITLPRSIAMAAATGAEWWGWITGKEPTFTRFKVGYTRATRWHNIEKARRVLGYEPEVGVEGIKRMVDVSAMYNLKCPVPRNAAITHALQLWG